MLLWLQKLFLFLFLSSEKKTVKYRTKIPEAEAQDRGIGDLNFHCFLFQSFLCDLNYFTKHLI